MAALAHVDGAEGVGGARGGQRVARQQREQPTHVSLRARVGADGRATCRAAGTHDAPHVNRLQGPQARGSSPRRRYLPRPRRCRTPRPENTRRPPRGRAQRPRASCAAAA
eukprot:3794764-Prymnesium_polylepis.1